jgi:hypothetical protein
LVGQTLLSVPYNLGRAYADRQECLSYAAGISHVDGEGWQLLLKRFRKEIVGQCLARAEAFAAHCHPGKQARSESVKPNQGVPHSKTVETERE